ncbi:MAG: RNA polymerase sigma factor [bacterium]
MIDKRLFFLGRALLTRTRHFPHTQAMSDEDLLRRWQAGDRAAGSAFFRAQYPVVVRFLRNKVADDVRDDLVQQTFMAAATADFAGRSSLRTWLLGIAWRCLASHYRSAGRVQAREVELGTQSVADLGRGPESQAAFRQEERLLLEGLRRIPVHCQVALELHYWEGMSAADIAEVTDTPLGTIKTRLRDGRLALERVLRTLAASPDALQSTLDDLQGWARRVREAWNRPE